jgi:hypothetical protein
MSKGMKIRFKCKNHEIEIENMAELEARTGYGDRIGLVLPNGKIPKRKLFDCPVCGNLLHCEHSLITVEQYEKEKSNI